MWNFEIVEVRGRKVENFGDPYTAILTLTIVDGEAHVEGLLSTEKFTKEDRKELEAYLMSLGHTTYKTSSYVEGERVIQEFNIGGTLCGKA